MTREELEHAIRAACDVSDDTEVHVFGSQAILGPFPDAPASLRQSVEVDMAPVHRLDQIDAIDGALGELSPFHATHGFYVHGIPVEAATLPDGWRGRLVKVQNANTRQRIGWCLAAADLAASKLVAFRDKDRAFVRALLGAKLIAARELIDALLLLPIQPTERDRLIVWIRSTAGDFAR